MAENPDTGAWLVAGGVAVGIVGLVWFLTRSSSPTSAPTASSSSPAPPFQTPASTPGNYNETYGPAYTPPTPPPPPRPDYQITAQNTSISLRVGQVLAIAQPHPAGPNQNWGISIYPPQQGGAFVSPDAQVQDLGWQSDYTDQVKPTAAGTSTVVMNLYDDSHGQVIESYSIAVSAS